MISQTAEYALRAVVCLGSRPGTPLKVQDMADMAQVPPGYLSKVMQALGRAGLVNSQRGLHGGFALARSLHELTVLEVVNAVDPIKRIEICPLGLRSHGANLCPLHRRIDDAIAMVERSFGDCTVSDLLTESNGSTPLCEAPGTVRLSMPQPKREDAK